MACPLSPRCHTPQNQGQGAVLSPGHPAGLRTNLATITNGGDSLGQLCAFSALES